MESSAPDLSDLSCKEMPDLIVRNYFRSLPKKLRQKVELHLANCPHCMMRSQALATAAKHHSTRRSNEV